MPAGTSRAGPGKYREWDILAAIVTFAARRKQPVPGEEYR